MSDMPVSGKVDYFRIGGDTAAIPKKASNLRVRSAVDTVDTALVISRN
jgi:hypothetical protein